MNTVQNGTALVADAPPRERRPLRMDAPQIYEPITEDGVRIRLTRYQGGDKGPVVLSPGFGTSSLAFTIDTVRTNFPEYLYEHGYDVWLLDYRASPDLPSSSTQFSIDDIATKDYPAAVNQVRSTTGRDSVQVMAHCVGSMSFLMAMLAGLSGVRSAVCSQLTTHPVAPPLNRIKAGMHLASLLPAIGIETMTTDISSHADWREHLFDRMLTLYPNHDHCDSPTCHRILFMYGEVYKHAQLNQATHDAIHEMFGVANMQTFQHLAVMLQHGHIVDRTGGDVYLPHLERLAIPIAFIHGVENGLFLLKGSEITYNLLREANGSGLYHRHVIPDYAHMDCFIGKDADCDVFPIVMAELDKAN